MISIFLVHIPEIFMIPQIWNKKTIEIDQEFGRDVGIFRAFLPWISSTLISMNAIAWQIQKL